MEENRNLEQAGAASIVSTGKKYESRKRETSGKDVLAIRSFLESLSVYEADALRVSIAIADGKATATIGRCFPSPWTRPTSAGQLPHLTSVLHRGNRSLIILAPAAQESNCM